MGQNTQIIITSIVVLGAIAIIIAVFRNLRKQEKENAKKQKEPEEKPHHVTIPVQHAATPVKKDEPVKEAKVLDKLIIVKRPGGKVNLYGSNDSIIAWCMKRAGKQYSEAKLIDCSYVENRNQPGRKKAKGYWKFTIKYAVGN